MPKDAVYCKRGNDNQKQVRTNNEKLNHLLASVPRCSPTLVIFESGERTAWLCLSRSLQIFGGGNSRCIYLTMNARA
jgi:hypothetical protein